MTELEIRSYKESDFMEIRQLTAAEGWHNLAARSEEWQAAWRSSQIALVALAEGELAGYVRGLTDGVVTLYICELLVRPACRGLGAGKALLQRAHALYPETRMEMLASSTSHTYYEARGFRPFYGFRKTMNE
ncbi:GNAT family N-acetyltransferase [Ectobacillus ponti]|uniref:GNAT family N-acetyltransferase n=1 Tax=Ectobacillus ponti TaxID=2961894 RepID=A0AA41XBW3_9BACI|nr:GNAT family N-acetyltransferase [Ectobacillus ponti]MCP8970833.1 GNAT family N-acetyltransferase [Ectobacillus ponti]